ncbi:response regulator [Vulcaniibacterium tengchongense]|uniref:Hpt domain-containing protein n=1 Tax=Vulcaniibacterium tengchongense TaxID=1273429 RepID=A0A3N4VVJ2_9GAMM|nr:response regulator [Vulcaniibacterium tengchongense]RPE77094.1 Hpt domain-containing protein [Vulcaniibacterium tengchongense]
MTPDGPPRLLLVEDDPTSRAFFAAALQGLPAEVDAADGVAAAAALARRHRYALWLIDAHLPDGSGAELLARLRAHDARTPALAHTAAHERDVHDALRAAGFADVLVKPLSADALQRAARARLGGSAGVREAASDYRDDAEAPLWDDDAALRALNGQRGHVDSLRGLFVKELPKTLQAIAAAAARSDSEAVRGELHRLRASCGFVGAARLEAAVRALQAAPASPDALARLRATAELTLARRPAGPAA